ncbi:MerR family DNA-binding transcriptional regulator [Carbonactinospora thermoautotrophica]|uniref:Heat shock protein hspR n=1 Tax=Carbonactinospora thermoautotrophica TaxID=1469144 RepID=A0A132MJ52_9ACTN|nr:helix-turn-helix transcriptional regulator [Carbonactinospora thermoautotrophica]KWW97795.1 heat shock protein hspR [Carbonactinospora thermoautotrophica]KWW98492.1 Transcriptional regulator [Carbonactinospora thermoautotrophica]KWX06733.1 heat shock protein hspR [Carbonactinospora thermoautotrophica]MCX9193637.1 MerR family DNA-binding transcriptional regulator [Carbonactinospora thermoautotrophica]
MAGTERGPFELSDDSPVYVISVAAQLSGLHAQTLRQYDRLGIVSPGRTPGGGRRYSARDIQMLREVQRLSQEEGINLAGIKRILELQAEVAALRRRIAELELDLDAAYAAARQRDAQGSPSYRADLLPIRQIRQSTALVVWKPPTR